MSEENTKKMNRRKLLQSAAVAGVATAAASSFPAPALSQNRQQWKMVMTWPLNFPGLGTSAQRVGKRITQMSGGRIEVKVYGAGELVPAFQSFDAVSKGDAEMYHGCEYYWMGKHKAFGFLAAVPFGLTGGEMHGWMNYGGGQELWDELSAEFNIKGFAGASTGVQMGGWYRKEINSLDDFKGLKFRMPGIGGEVLRRLGVAVVNLSGGEIFPALSSGAIDGTEWVGPWHDMAFGFYKVAKNYYYPGFHEPGTLASVGINKKVWDGLNKDDQAMIQVVMQAEANLQGSEFTARNVSSLDVLIKKHGVKVHRYSDDILNTIGALSGDVVSEIGATDAMSKIIYDSYISYRKNAISWGKLGEQGFMTARLLPFKYS